MPDLTLHDIPDHLYRELKSAAILNDRSLNEEILARLGASVPSEQVVPEGLLERIRARRGTFGHLDLRADNLRRMREAGRL